jgi:hypothetical protein
MENIFAQFHGADLERLTDCIAAVRKNGLSIDQYTHAGINDNSGNVWIWNENWVGCVYCSIGFDIQWSWSCGDCGEEYDFDTYQEMDDFVSTQNDLTDCNGCEKCYEVEVEA